ncbi:cell division protein [Capnocytophaga canimorsus]|nr:cell division protein [Capnocytophaga canimorsus]
MPLRELYSSEVKQLGVAWAFYSGKIEGNTYTFIETETLLKDGITAPRRYEDAKELKNLYNTFISEAEYIRKEGNTEHIDEKLLFRVHSTFMQDLISDEERGVLRKRRVGITGTNYKPMDNPFEIRQRFSEILYNQELIQNPFERAIYLHCNMAKLQPFIDGNKRTSRMLESIVLMNADIVPIFSKHEEDFNTYRKSLVHFYQTGDYSKYVDYLLEQKLKYLQYFTKEDLKEKFKL